MLRFPILTCVLVLIGATASGCKSADFAGGAGAAKKDQADDGGKDADDAGDAGDAGDADGDDVNGQGDADDTTGDIGGTDSNAGDGGLGGDGDSACVGKKSTTTVKLLTPTVRNGVAGNFIDYEISVVNCLGKRQAIPAEPVRFDIDGEVDESNNDFPYTLRSGASTVSGVLVEVVGTDLFGNVGVNFFHNKTDQSVALAADDVAVLHIDLQGTFFDQPSGDDGAGQTFPLDTYLGFGDATPVKQSVTFIP